MPEISGRSLEELDELFENKVSARKFATAETHGAARLVTEIEERKASVVRETMKGSGPEDQEI